MSKRGVDREQGHEAARGESYPHPLVSCLMPIFALAAVIGLGLWGFQFWQWSLPRDVTIPPVTGMRQQEATQRLHDVGLNVQVLPTRQTNEDIPDGAVIATDPAIGRRVKQGRTINLLLSSGSAYTVMPEVRELPQAEAIDRLQAAGLMAGKEDYVYHDTIGTDRIIVSTPKAGTKLRKGTAVALKISKGPQPPPSAQDETTPIADFTSTELVVKLPDDVPDPQVVRIDVTDDDGVHTVYNRQHTPGETLVQTVQGRGHMKVEVYFGPRLLMTRTY